MRSTRCLRRVVWMDRFGLKSFLTVLGKSVWFYWIQLLVNVGRLNWNLLRSDWLGTGGKNLVINLRLRCWVIHETERLCLLSHLSGRLKLGARVWYHPKDCMRTHWVGRAEEYALRIIRYRG